VQVCGLYRESLAAHAEARRLDPNIQTSFEQTLLLTGDVERMISTTLDAANPGADDGIRIIAMGLTAGARTPRQRWGG
jgi:hypothetical protein